MSTVNFAAGVFVEPGMNKLVINHLEKTIVTSDGATIVRELDVMHPAAKMVVMASQMQEQEAGDGTSLVVTLTGRKSPNCSHERSIPRIAGLDHGQACSWRQQSSACLVAFLSSTRDVESNDLAAW